MIPKKYLRWIILFLSEVLASAIPLFIGCLGCVDNSPYFKPTHLTISLAFGFAIMIAINSFGVISGGYMTPAITLAAFMYKTLDLPVID